MLYPVCIKCHSDMCLRFWGWGKHFRFWGLGNGLLSMWFCPEINVGKLTLCARCALLSIINPFSITQIHKVQCSSHTAYALTTDGKVYAWGDNSNSQIQYKAKSMVLHPLLLPVSCVKRLSHVFISLFLFLCHPNYCNIALFS